jgi:hypothetical protein
MTIFFYKDEQTMPMEIQNKFIVSTNLDESFWESSFV